MAEKKEIRPMIASLYPEFTYEQQLKAQTTIDVLLEGSRRTYEFVINNGGEHQIHPDRFGVLLFDTMYGEQDDINLLRARITALSGILHMLFNEALEYRDAFKLSETGGKN
jgi:hypothetical protein